MDGGDRPAEGAIEVALLLDFPAQHFGHLAVALGVQAIDERDLDFTGVGEKLGFIEPDEFLEIRHATHIAERGAGLDDVLQLVPEEGFLFEYAGERGSDQIDIDFARAAIDVLPVDDSGRLPLAPARTANREAGDEMESLPVQRRHDARLDVGSLDELPGLKRRLRAPQQAGAGIERDPDRHRGVGDLAIAAGEFQLRQLADDDGVAWLNGLEVVDALKNQVQAVVGPLLG